MVIFILAAVTIVTMVIGMPIAFSLGVSAFAALLAMGDIPLQIMAQKIYAGMDSFPLLCIPFFILAGELMSQGKITEALVEFSILLIGRVRGGLAMADVLASMFFGGMTGSAIAESSALGSVLIPMMNKAGYDRVFAASITSAAAVIGPIIPPSIPAVLYSLAAGTSIGALFMAGLVPGILLGLALMAAAYVISRQRMYPVREEKVTWRNILAGFRKVFLALLMPVIIVGGIISGVFTATEASAVAVGYALIVTLFITRQVKVAQLPRMLINSGVITAVVMIIVGTATIWGWVVAIEQVARQAAVLLTGFSPVMFLLMANVLLLFLGTFMDNVVIIILFAPTLAPIAAGLGIDPLHFGCIFVLNTTIGLITPPLGEVLFVAGPIAGVSLEEMSRGVFVFILVEVAVLLAVSYIPATTLWVPRLLGF
ncbi:MAG: TRAP transporter large permease [Thermodesulfobacteriota bacterium]